MYKQEKCWQLKESQTHLKALAVYVTVAQEGVCCVLRDPESLGQLSSPSSKENTSFPRPSTALEIIIIKSLEFDESK